jgi:hypothetical protein
VNDVIEDGGSRRYAFDLDSPIYSTIDSFREVGSDTIKKTMSSNAFI